MRVISEAQVRTHLDLEAAYRAVEQSFLALSKGEARNFPVVREALPEARAVFGVKSGVAAVRGWLGLKAGGYWFANAAVGMDNHQSTTLLFDVASGRPRAVVAGNYLTAARTAAASALSVALLAREDSETVAVIGTGTQAVHQLRAVARVRPIRRVVAWNRGAARGIAFRAAAVQATGLPVELVDTPREAVAQADVVLTLTSSNEPLLQSDWIQPGTHIAAMGADTRGKRELSTGLLAAADVYVDDLAQAVSIGECQHLDEDTRRKVIAGTLAQVLCGEIAGRADAQRVTIFDGTGFALQDIACAVHVMETLEPAAP